MSSVKFRIQGFIYDVTMHCEIMQGHEGAMRISYCTSSVHKARCSTECTDVSVAPDCPDVTMHHKIMLKSYYDMK